MPSGNIFQNISEIVDNIFNVYIRRQGVQEPFFAQFCNGTTVTCGGLSQWGTVTLANQGLNALQILRRYYPSDIDLIAGDNFADIPESYPGMALREGSQGPDVQTMQLYLNRIRVNYPAIPQIVNPNGYYGPDTTAAVAKFQEIFDLTSDGVIGKATWYKISYLYVAVKRLGELDSEGDNVTIGTIPPTVVLRQGASGNDVLLLQNLLNAINAVNPQIPTVSRDGVFGGGTAASVRAFQQYYGLSPDGIVGPATWNMLYAVYWNDDNMVTPPGGGSGGGGGTTSPPYPGTLLRYGSRGDSVRLMQQYLSALADYYPAIPKITPDGIYGWNTQNAVVAFQQRFGLSPDGIIGPATWNKIVEEYERLGQPGGLDNQEYPGVLLRQGSRGESVRLMQRYLNKIGTIQPAIPKLSEDGIFGAGTRSGVIAFQQLYGLPQDGIIGPQTWQSIVNEYNRITPMPMGAMSANGTMAAGMVETMSKVLLGKYFLGI